MSVLGHLYSCSFLVGQLAEASVKRSEILESFFATRATASFNQSGEREREGAAAEQQDIDCDLHLFSEKGNRPTRSTILFSRKEVLAFPLRDENGHRRPAGCPAKFPNNNPAILSSLLALILGDKG